MWPNEAMFEPADRCLVGVCITGFIGKEGACSITLTASF